MPKPLIRDDRVCRNQQFGTVDAIIERRIDSAHVLRIVVVQWDNGDVSDEDEEDLDTMLGRVVDTQPPSG